MSTAHCHNWMPRRSTRPRFQFCSYYNSATKPRFESGANVYNNLASDRCPILGGGLHPVNFVAGRTRSLGAQVQNQSKCDGVGTKRSAPPESTPDWVKENKALRFDRDTVRQFGLKAARFITYLECWLIIESLAGALEHLDACRKAVHRGKQDATQCALFRIRRVGGQPVNPGGIARRPSRE